MLYDHYTKGTSLILNQINNKLRHYLQFFLSVTSPKISTA